MNILGAKFAEYTFKVIVKVCASKTLYSMKSRLLKHQSENSNNRENNRHNGSSGASGRWTTDISFRANDISDTALGELASIIAQELIIAVILNAAVWNKVEFIIHFEAAILLCAVPSGHFFIVAASESFGIANTVAAAASMVV